MRGSKRLPCKKYRLIHVITFLTILSSLSVLALHGKVEKSIEEGMPQEVREFYTLFSSFAVYISLL